MQQQASVKRISWWRLPGRLVWDLIFTAICLVVIALAIIALAAVAWALPAFLICWIVVRIWYWLVTRVPMWLDFDRMNLGRIHRWPYLGNLLLCLLIFTLSWWILRRPADGLVKAYAEAIAGNKVTGRPAAALQDIGEWFMSFGWISTGVGWLVDAVAWLQHWVSFAIDWTIGFVITLPGPAQLLAVIDSFRPGQAPPVIPATPLPAVDAAVAGPGPGLALFALLMLATIVLLFQVTSDAKRLCMIEKAKV